jgi:hypothetical protein
MSLPSISYELGVPVPTNNPAQDVGSMQSNTNAISNIISTDHIGFNVAGNSGCHDQANFIITSNSGPTAPSTLSGNAVTLYASKINEGGTFGNSPELFFIRQNNGTQIQLTGPGVPDSSGNFGITFLPGGFLLQWGKVFSSSSASGVTYAFNTTSPNITFPVKCMQIFAQSGVVNPLRIDSWTISAFDQTGFTLITGTLIPNATPFSWIAIGF